MTEGKVAVGERGVCLWTVVFFLGLYLLLSGEGFYSTDGETMLRSTWALVDRQRLSVPCDPGQPSAIKGRAGQCYSRYGLGQPIAAIPLYLLSKGVAAAVPGLDYGETLRFMMPRFNPIITALTCGLLCSMGAWWYRSRKIGLVLALLYGLCTLALPYARFYFNEPLTTLSLLVATYGVMVYAQERRKEWLVGAGAAFGYAVLTRTTSAVVLPLFLIYVWLAGRHGPSDISARLKAVAAFVLPVILLGLIQAGYQYWAFGSPFAGGYEGEGWQTPLLTGLYGLLFSPGKSLLLFVPLALLAPWGWFRLAADGRRRESLLFVSVCLVWLVVHAGWWTWHGGWSWGPRFMVPLLPFLILPMGALWAQGRGARIAILVLALAGLAVQLGGVLVNFNDFMLLVNDENKILFNPAFLPILGHWRMILSGSTPDLVIVHLPAWGQALWGAACGGLILLGGVKAWKAAVATQREATP